MTANLVEGHCEAHLQQLGISPVESNPMGLKIAGFELPDTTDGGATLTITLANYGISKIWGVQCFIHTTKDDVIVVNTDITTSVTAGVLTVALASGAEDLKRTVMVVGT